MASEQQQERAYAVPQLGASLMLAFSPSALASSSSAPAAARRRRNLVLILSPQPTRLSSLRAFAALEAGYNVLIGARESDGAGWDPELRARLLGNEVSAVSFALAADASAEDWASWYEGAISTEQKDMLALALLHDTTLALPAGQRRTHESAAAFADLFSGAHRVPVSIADAPALSDFSFPTTHRFACSSDIAASSATSTAVAPSSPLQLALTTNAHSCALASRLRREIVASLPPNVGDAVKRIGELRAEVKALEQLAATTPPPTPPVDASHQLQHRAVEVAAASTPSSPYDSGAESEEPEEERTLEINRPAEQRGRCGSRRRRTQPTAATPDMTRMRYIAQVSSYYPLAAIPGITLASITDSALPALPSEAERPTRHALSPSRSRTPMARLGGEPRPQRAQVVLLGTGPGSPLLLTQIAHQYLTCTDPSSPFYVDLFLSDKLVPSPILDLIPPSRRARTSTGAVLGVVDPARPWGDTARGADCVHIARKFPGNAEASQEELYDLGLAALRAGRRVARLKQGDPLVFGRVGEELLRFRSHGFEPVLVPGMSAALAGAGTAGLMLTMRGVAGGLSIGTGVGRGGKDEAVEPYERNKTRVLLMGVGRLAQLVERMLAPREERGGAYPPHTPIAVVERGSLPDQRVISTTLSNVVRAMNDIGAHRPPAMLVIGWAVLALDANNGKGDEDVLRGEGSSDAAPRSLKEDEHIVSNWLGPRGVRVREGLGEGWRALEDHFRLLAQQQHVQAAPPATVHETRDAPSLDVAGEGVANLAS